MQGEWFSFLSAEEFVQPTSLNFIEFQNRLAIGVYKDLDEIKKLWGVAQTFVPLMPEDQRHQNWNGWCKAVSKSLGWVDTEREAMGKGNTLDDESFDDFQDADDGFRKKRGYSLSILAVCTIGALATGFLLGTSRRSRS